jgi:hypothetical protein
MNPRNLLVLTPALILGCGSAQHARASEETLVDGFPALHPAQQRPGRNGKCRAPEWQTVLVKAGGCWVQLDATPEQCEQFQRESPYYVLHEGRCWYPLPGNGRNREPTSSL